MSDISAAEHERAISAKDAELAAANEQIAMLRSAIATPEIYAGVISEIVEKDFAKRIEFLEGDIAKWKAGAEGYSQRISWLCKQIKQLLAWKKSAMFVLGEWDDTYKACGSPGPLGSSKAKATAEMLHQLNESISRLRYDYEIALLVQLELINENTRLREALLEARP